MPYQYVLCSFDHADSSSNLLADIKTSDPSALAFSNQPRGGENKVAGLRGSLKSLGINHGDLLFASYPPPQDDASSDPPPPLVANGAASTSTSVEAGSSKAGSSVAAKPWQHVEEDEVDKYWEKKDGKIPRPRDTRMCRHGAKSMCDYCMPLEPYDANYQKEHNIKYLSHYAYLKSILPPSSSTWSDPNSATYIPPLTPPFYKVQSPCPTESHAPYPAGICTKCQPSAITLALQKFRMVDHVEFSDPQTVRDFFNFWQQTRLQRFGFLIGRYEPYELVPMGVKAVVEAIYEPPQEGSPDGIKIGMPWEEEGRIGDLANLCGGLKIVGCIYTDLELDEEKTQEAKSQKFTYKRHADSYYLSCLEIIFAARRQLNYQTPSKYSYTGKFSSRFVTCVLSGNKDGDTEVTAYQVSDQAMGLAEANIVRATNDPGQLKIVEPSDDVYVPDVFYRYKNEYNIEVKESAKPCFPVEYLLVTVSHGVPALPNPQFLSPAPFEIENRPGFQDQDLTNLVERKLAPLLKQGDELAIAKWLSDFHLLAFLDTSGMFGKEDMRVLGSVATAKSDKERKERVNKLGGLAGWQTLVTIAHEATAPRFQPTPAAVQPAPQTDDIPADYFDDFPAEEDIEMDSAPSQSQPPRGAGTGTSGSAGAGGGRGARSEDVQMLMGLAGCSAEEAEG
ncbi:polyubiquitin-tagged protein recognition complex, Npl4 component, partial [Atractiella rhizophila]